MERPDPDNSAEPQRRRPSRRWYVLAGLLLLVSFSVFAYAVMDGRRQGWSRIEAMPRFVGPSAAGSVVELAEPGDYVVYYENRGTIDGRSFDTPRHQVWTTPTLPAMTCTVTPADGGEPLAVRLLGQTGDDSAAFDADRDTSVIYGRADGGGDGRQGTGVWTVTVSEPGRYVFDVSYREAVYLDPDSVEVPDALSRDEQAETSFAEAEQREQDRAEAIARYALATLEPVEVLFAVGPDPTAEGYFQVIGLRGAASVLAFGFTASMLIALVTFMLRTGQVTERGTMESVRRGVRG